MWAPHSCESPRAALVLLPHSCPAAPAGTWASGLCQCIAGVLPVCGCEVVATATAPRKAAAWLLRQQPVANSDMLGMSMRTPAVEVACGCRDLGPAHPDLSFVSPQQTQVAAELTWAGLEPAGLLLCLCCASPGRESQQHGCCGWCTRAAPSLLGLSAVLLLLVLHATCCVNQSHRLWQRQQCLQARRKRCAVAHLQAVHVRLLPNAAPLYGLQLPGVQHLCHVIWA